MNLYQIFSNSNFNGGNYSSSQDIANQVPIVETLPAGVITVTAYAKYAGFTQDPGIYQAGLSSATQYFSSMSQFGSIVFPLTQNGIFSINGGQITASTPFGFFDNTGGGGVKYTELSLNDLGQLGQSNGLIFEISPTHYIVAFEDGAGYNSLGDQDYNDLVLNVKCAAVPKSTASSCLIPFKAPKRSGCTKSTRKKASKSGRQIHYVIQASFKPSSRPILGEARPSINHSRLWRTSLRFYPDGA